MMDKDGNATDKPATGTGPGDRDELTAEQVALCDAAVAELRSVTAMIRELGDLFRQATEECMNEDSEVMTDLDAGTPAPSGTANDAADSENSTDGDDEAYDALVRQLEAYRDCFGSMAEKLRPASEEREREYSAPSTDRNAGTPAPSGHSDAGGPSQGGAADSHAHDRATGAPTGADATEQSN